MKGYFVSSSKSQWYGIKCLQCDREAKVGDAVLVQRHPTANARPNMVWHRRCIEDLLSRSPSDHDDPVVEEFRQSLLETGRYVEAVV